MDGSFDFIWDPVKDKFNLEFFEPEEYDMDSINMLYQQMVLFY